MHIQFCLVYGLVFFSDSEKPPSQRSDYSIHFSYECFLIISSLDCSQSPVFL